jgi:hypothetical protein
MSPAPRTATPVDIDDLVRLSMVLLEPELAGKLVRQAAGGRVGIL